MILDAPLPVAFGSSHLIKDSIAARMRHEILDGTLAPGEPIVEGKWAVRLGVAQSSIRAALNILESEGFVERGNGRSARVTHVSPDDVPHNFEVRVALESLAARLVTIRQPDLSDLDQVVADMRSAVNCRNLQAFYERDLRFHLTLCEKAGNPVLTQMLRRLLVPLFAFVIIRTHEKMGGAERWLRSITQHEQILASIRAGDPAAAAAEVAGIIGYFSTDIDELTRRKSKTRKSPAKKARR
ncbi:MAG TPA: GntR family transcriptional regulator [Bryobacteraceae bacterium]|nr:GntR family transcriptional regulator [Bryobacteraceae bacterium]